MKKSKIVLAITLILAFIIILCITFLVTSLYFRYARYYLIELLHVQGIEFSELDKDRVVDGVIGAVFETVTLSAIIGLVLVIVVFKHIVGPIRKMTLATKKVAKGDFTVQIDNGRKHRRDEIGLLTDNFNMMVRELESNEYLSKEFMSKKAPRNGELFSCFLPVGKLAIFPGLCYNFTKIIVR